MKNAFELKTLAGFMEHFKDEDACRQHFTAIRFTEGEYCVHCGHGKVYSFASGKRYRCAKCKQDFTIKTGTVFGESKLPLRKWFIAIYLLSTSNKGISSVELAKRVGVTQKTGWFMDHRIRTAMKQRKNLFTRTCEADETYVGGKRKGGKRGRGAAGKTPVIGIREREGKIVAKATADVSSQSLIGNIYKNVQIGTTVMTDELPAYRWLGRVGYDHQTVNHGTHQYVKGEIHTNGIESFWALFKRGYHGIYHWMSPKHLQRYLDESAFRFNRKAQDLGQTFSDLIVRVAESNKLSYKELTA